MKITLFPTHCFSESGQRQNNEDSIFPVQEDLQKDSDTKLFIVCDGVGGAEKGEEASRIACETFAESLHNKTVSEKDLSEALKEAEGAIDDYIKVYPNAKGMATTLALLAIHQQGFTIAHIGDSRAYQVRNGKIIFKTTDHSFVNELVAQQIITEEEAVNHPKKNIVTRAIIGGSTPQEVDVAISKDVKPNDYFFLCSDGVLESISDQKLIEVLYGKDASDSDKMEAIKTICRQHSKDNFSAHLIRVADVRKTNDTTQQTEHTHKENSNKSNGLFLYGVLIFIFIIIMIVNNLMIFKSTLN